LTAALRIQVKRQSVRYPLDRPEVKAQLYRSLYGARMALDQALLQAPADTVEPLMLSQDVPSRTPQAVVEGVSVHSGDLLLSRGGAPTSALIARGNDFPGNFSHVALVYVPDGNDPTPLAIEAHIEKGVGISSVEDYLTDKKLRILVLRPRPDHPSLERDPTLPAKAARAMFERATSEHIPYDFAMNFRDASSLFCSEVASAAYDSQHFDLWLELSHLSSPVLRAWLRGLGVKHFVTEAPSDLEYDPSLSLVAEWRDRDGLLGGYIDDALIDALLDAETEAAPLPHNAMALPFYRVLKGLSAALNAVGLVGPIPEGMSATSAARTAYFSSVHERLHERVAQDAARFEVESGYPPPYWQLFRFAQARVAEDPL
jgi:hypothetical protein